MAENVVSCSGNAYICSNQPLTGAYFARSGRMLSIDTNVSANYRQLYAQAMTLIYHGKGIGWMTSMKLFCINPTMNPDKYRHWRNDIVVAFILWKRKRWRMN